MSRCDVTRLDGRLGKTTWTSLKVLRLSSRWRAPISSRTRAIGRTSHLRACRRRTSPRSTEDNHKDARQLKQELARVKIPFAAEHYRAGQRSVPYSRAPYN